MPRPAGQTRLGRHAGRRRAAAVRSSSLPPSFLLPKRDLPSLGRRDHAAPAGWTFARFEQHTGAEPPSSIGSGGYLAHFDVGQPERAAGPALDDPASKIASHFERLIAAGAVLDLLRAPLQELGVEGAGGPQVAGVQLEMHNGTCKHSRQRFTGRRAAVVSVFAHAASCLRSSCSLPSVVCPRRSAIASVQKRSDERRESDGGPGDPEAGRVVAPLRHGAVLNWSTSMDMRWSPSIATSYAATAVATARF